MIRVGDLQRSLDFYTQVLGMRELRRKDYPEGRFTNVFVGYDDESCEAVLELTHNWDTASYCLCRRSGRLQDRVYSEGHDVGGVRPACAT